MNFHRERYVIPCATRWRRAAALIVLYGTSAAIVIGAGVAIWRAVR
jgi:hypothetical protein